MSNPMNGAHGMGVAGRAGWSLTDSDLDLESHACCTQVLLVSHSSHTRVLRLRVLCSGPLCITLARCLPSLSFPFASPPMEISPGGPWICGECDKVCKSRGGLTQHSSVHKRHPRIGVRRNDSHRIYHAKLDGMFIFFVLFCRF